MMMSNLNVYSAEILMKQQQAEIARAARDTWKFSGVKAEKRLPSLSWLRKSKPEPIPSLCCVPCC